MFDILFSVCKLIFMSETADEPLMTMEKGIPYYVILPSESCSLNLAASLYFDCGGKWKKLGWNTSSTELVYTKQQSPPTNLQWEYSFIVSTGTTTLCTSTSQYKPIKKK